MYRYIFSFFSHTIFVALYYINNCAGIAGNYKSREDFTLTHDIEKEISPDSPVHHRTKAIKELSDAVLNQQWEDVCVHVYRKLYHVILVNTLHENKGIKQNNAFYV